MGKKCDLCGGVARMYCESDQASLCWDCDGKVHGANFLVAKHTRCLLCSACQSLTPWKATGRRLGPTSSVCDSCLDLQNSDDGDCFSSDRRIREEDGDGDGAESYDDDEDEDEDEDYSDEEEDDDEEAENQVVPWAEPSPVAKRPRDSDDVRICQEEIGSSSTQDSDYSRPLKRPSLDELSSNSTALINSIIERRSAFDSSSITRRDLSR